MQLAATAGTPVSLALAVGADQSEPYVVYSAFESALFDRREVLEVA